MKAECLFISCIAYLVTALESHNENTQAFHQTPLIDPSEETHSRELKTQMISVILIMTSLRNKKFSNFNSMYVR